MEQHESWIQTNQETYGGIIIAIIATRLFFGFIVLNKETSKDATDAFSSVFNMNESLYLLMSIFVFLPVKNQNFRIILYFLNFLLIVQWILILFGFYIFVKNSP